MRFTPLAAMLLAASSAHAQGSTWSPKSPLELGVGLVAASVSATTYGLTQAQRAKSADAQCASHRDCADTYQCSAHRCVRRDDPKATQQRDATRLFLEARVVELREELALGRGPVIAGLAAAAEVPAAKLGLAMRAHRAELVALIGDGSDPGWAARFLQQVDALGATACASPS